MYAIVQVGGRQYRASVGARLLVDRMEVEPGSQVRLDDVRLVVAVEGDQLQTQVGQPTVEGVTVSARAMRHFRGPKVLVFKYKPKKRYRRRRGFRSELTELLVEAVGAPAAEAEAGAPARRRRSGRTEAPESVSPAATPAPAAEAQSPVPKARPGSRSSTAPAAPRPRGGRPARAAEPQGPSPAKPPSGRRRPGASAPAKRQPTTEPGDGA
ncbi:MAG: 50S ribosomal protein L21 [Candidatus Dormibacteria bacterium]